jgi:hypothetical protein
MTNIDSVADIQTVETLNVDKEHVLMESLAKHVAQSLTRAYPNYPWAVGWHYGGVLCVKLMLAADSNYGYTIDAYRLHSAHDLARQSVMAGGELLERLNMKRGAWDGDMPTQNYDGVDKGHEAPIFGG